MEFKAFHDKQTVKGHRRTKSAEVREKLFKNKKSPTTSKDSSMTTSEAVLHTDDDDTKQPKPNRKLGFQALTETAPIAINKTVAKVATGDESVAVDTVTKDPILTDVVAKDSGVTIEDAELAIEASCEKSAKILEEFRTLDEEIQTTENHFPAEVSRDGFHTGLHLKLEETYDTFSQQEILESQEFASTPTTQDNKYIPLLSSNNAGAPDSAPRGDPTQYSSSLHCPPTAPYLTTKKDETWQDLEMRRRKIKDKIKKRKQYESGERGELHPK